MKGFTPGRGYLLYSGTGASMTESGVVPASAPTWTVAAGWNLVGIAQGTTPLSAAAVLQGVLQQSGGSLAALYRLTGSQWSPPVILQRITL
jgi:hypothetical protein